MLVCFPTGIPNISKQITVANIYVSCMNACSPIKKKISVSKSVRITSGKEPAYQCRRCKRLGFDPWVGKIPWRRAWHPTPVFSTGESCGQRSLAGYSSWGHKESDTTEVTYQACRDPPGVLLKCTRKLQAFGQKDLNSHLRGLSGHQKVSKEIS